MRDIKKLQEGQVNCAKEHFELRYESEVKFESGWSDWVPVALVGPPRAGIITVQFLIEPTDLRNKEAINAAKKELQFYLFDKGERDPWTYAHYHCWTDANIYSKVHWEYLETQSQGETHGSAEPQPSGNKRPGTPRKLTRTKKSSK